MYQSEGDARASLETPLFRKLTTNYDDLLKDCMKKRIAIAQIRGRIVFPFLKCRGRGELARCEHKPICRWLLENKWKDDKWKKDVKIL